MKNTRSFDRFMVAETGCSGLHSTYQSCVVPVPVRLRHSCASSDALALLIVALAACYVPGLRAAQVDSRELTAP
jgi:hypothetical protein